MFPRRSLVGPALLSLFSIAPSSGAVTFLPATPYLSAADSPFDLSGLGTTFFLEDFEDGVWNLPPGVVGAAYTIQGPGNFTDSVDADDGVIDGSGTQGHSLRPSIQYYNPTNPPTFSASMEIRFDSSILGMPINAIGFVWTDGLPISSVNLSILDSNGNRSFHVYRSLMDSIHTGDTSSHFFLAAISETPIVWAGIGNFYRSSAPPEDHFEIDHIQFGYVVPEPGFPLQSSAIVALLVAAGCHVKMMRFQVRRKEICHEARDLQIGEEGGGWAGCMLRRWRPGCCLS